LGSGGHSLRTSPAFTLQSLRSFFPTGSLFSKGGRHRAGHDSNLPLTLTTFFFQPAGFDMSVHFYCTPPPLIIQPASCRRSEWIHVPDRVPPFFRRSFYFNSPFVFSLSGPDPSSFSSIFGRPFFVAIGIQYVIFPGLVLPGVWTTDSLFFPFVIFPASRDTKSSIFGCEVHLSVRITLFHRLISRFCDRSLGPSLYFRP